MDALVPALLAGAGTAVALGLPTPARRAVVGGQGSSLRLSPAVTALVAGGALVVPLGPVGAAVGAVLVLLGQRALAERKARAAREAERSAAVEAMAVLAAELRAGRTPADALSSAARLAVGPAGRALSAAATAVGFGALPTQALVSRAEESAVPDLLRALAACWQVCHGTGSSLAVAIDRMEHGLREEQRCREAVESELAGPRATAGLLAGLPILGLCMAAGLGARPVHVLLHTPVGNGALVLGVALDLIGLWWTGRIVVAAGAAR